MRWCDRFVRWRRVSLTLFRKIDSASQCNVRMTSGNWNNHTPSDSLVLYIHRTSDMTIWCFACSIKELTMYRMNSISRRLLSGSWPYIDRTRCIAQDRCWQTWNGVCQRFCAESSRCFNRSHNDTEKVFQSSKFEQGNSFDPTYSACGIVDGWTKWFLDYWSIMNWWWMEVKW